MGSRFKTQRSTEAPMDFQFTSRPSSNVKPVWATSTDDPITPKKRPHDTLYQQSYSLSQNPPTFGSNRDVPFIFQTPPPQTPYVHPWAPPSEFSPTKPLLEPISQEEIKDVDMNEPSPPKPIEKKSEVGRAIALGGMRRVFNSRSRKRENEKALMRQGRGGNDDTEQASEDEDDDTTAVAPLTRNTSHHYTLNLPSPPTPHSDLPFILSGYLQFFFNFSLILLFLYLAVQFIITVQRDVEQKISEYSMDIVQEIAMCALQYKNNLCASNPIPAMARQCGNWETCMNRDPTVVGRARVGAELIAEVVNGFVEPISWKTLAFTLTSLSFLTLFINAFLTLYRSRHHPSHVVPATHHQPFAVPPAVAGFPPNHLGAGFLSPAPTPSWGRAWRGYNDEDPQTPSRRRRLEGGEAVDAKPS